MITSLLEDIFNHLLQTDPDSKDKLAALSGKSVGFDITNMPIYLLATIHHEGLVFSLGSIENADCILRGRPVSLARYLNAKQVNPSTNANLGVEIEGDLEFARKISNIFRGLNIDWEGVFAQLIGDFPANQMATVFSSLRGGLERSKDSAQQHLHYLVTERLDQIVTQSEAEAFYQAVDKLEADAGRLEQKISQLTGFNTRG